MIGKVKKIIKKIIRKELDNNQLDNNFLQFDKGRIRRTNNISLIPNLKNRIGGKVSFGEWAHVIGIFQTLIFQNLDKKDGNKILDIGCGTGLLGLASQNFVNNGGEYLGIDVDKSNIEFCKSHYNNHKQLKFLHFDVNNAMYAERQTKVNQKWNVESNSQDLVTALSVWTHFNEEDAIFYFNEVSRVLKKDAKAIISFFYLDDIYFSSVDERKNEKGRYHMTNQKEWIFNKSAYGSKNWYYPEHLEIPENATGITKEGMSILLEKSGLELINYYSGNWKEKPGVYFQDVLIFQKK